MNSGAGWARVHGTIDRQTRLSTHRDKPRHYTTLTAESEEELKSLLMKVKVEREKDGLKLNIQKTKIMVSSPITSWQIDRETMKTDRLYFLGFQKWLQMVTAAMKLTDACFLEEKL